VGAEPGPDDAAQRLPAADVVDHGGDLELRIPKLREGSFFPSLLERRRRVDQALFAVIMEAYLHGGLLHG
jgi:putative transposase